MKKIVSILVIILFLMVHVTAMGAGTATYTITEPRDGKAMIINVSVTDDGASGTTATFDNVVGWWFCSMETNPGSTAPTDNYDIALNTAGGFDILGGAGENRDTASTETAYPTIDSTTGQKACVPVNSPLTMSVSGNSVANAVIGIKFFFQRP